MKNDIDITTTSESATSSRHFAAAKMVATTYLASLDEEQLDSPREEEDEEESNRSTSGLQKIIQQAKVKAEHIGNDIYALIEMAEMHCKNRWRMDTFELFLVTICLAYVAAPIDTIPDILPSIGLTDDAMVVALAVDTLRDNIVRFRAWKDANFTEYQEGKEEVVCEVGGSCTIM